MIDYNNLLLGTK